MKKLSFYLFSFFFCFNGISIKAQSHDTLHISNDSGALLAFCDTVNYVWITDTNFNTIIENNFVYIQADKEPDQSFTPITVFDNHHLPRQFIIKYSNKKIKGRILVYNYTKFPEMEMTIRGHGLVFYNVLKQYTEAERNTLIKHYLNALAIWYYTEMKVSGLSFND